MQLGETDPVLPEGAIPNSIVRVMQYVDADGGLGIATSVSSDVPLSQTLGVLLIGAIDIYLRSNRDEPRDRP